MNFGVVNIHDKVIGYPVNFIKIFIRMYYVSGVFHCILFRIEVLFTLEIFRK
jgi:hypothetical protein